MTDLGAEAALDAEHGESYEEVLQKVFQWATEFEGRKSPPPGPESVFNLGSLPEKKENGDPQESVRFSARLHNAIEEDFRARKSLETPTRNLSRTRRSRNRSNASRRGRSGSRSHNRSHSRSHSRSRSRRLLDRELVLKREQEKVRQLELALQQDQDAEQRRQCSEQRWLQRQRSRSRSRTGGDRRSKRSGTGNQTDKHVT